MDSYTNQGSKDTRSGFGEGLTELGRSNSNVVALCADLTGSLKMGDFAKENPERFFQAEDGIRDRSPSRGLGDVYKRQHVILIKQN